MPHALGDGPTLADVGLSAAAAVGVPGCSDVLGVGPARHVIVCLVDGLGWDALKGDRLVAPGLSSLAGEPIDAVFPTTTPVGLGSLGTGLLPGAHGLVGAAFEYAETGEMLTPLKWGSHPTPVAVQPEPTVFERVARSGVTMTSVSPAAYENSGLTRAALRGALYAPAEDITQRVAAVSHVLASADRSFTYVYWPHLDRIGHEFGGSSSQWREGLSRVEQLVSRLVDAMVPGAAMIVTSDHGMVDCPADRRIAIEADLRLMAGVRRIGGEPRARHVYTDHGAALDVQSAWQAVLGDRALVLTRRELIDRGYLGDVDPALEERIGDVMAVTREDWMLSSAFDRRVSGLLGQHGGLTPSEVRIPALIHRS